MAYPDLIMQMIHPERQRSYAEYILKSGNHLLALVKDVLDLAKIESGSLQVSIEHVALPDLLDEVTSTVEAMARQSGIALSSMPLPGTSWRCGPIGRGSCRCW
jgi:signal transduction histidine kinase